MASSSIRLLLFFSLLCLSAIGATARPGIHFHPCKTLFISYTISSFKPSHEIPQSDSSSSDQNDQNPSGFFAIYREFNEFEPKSLYSSSETFLDRPDFPRPFGYIASSAADEPRRPEILHPVPFVGSFGVSSLRERTKDILSVVLALLFGVGCGALTSATMYLVWSVIASRREIHAALIGEDSDEEESPKGMGYVKVPASPVKEGYEGN